MISIRAESSDDHNDVRRVVVDAFTESDFGYHGEADIVEALRRDCDDLLSLVAVVAGDIVGHILFSPVTIRSPNNESLGMGLAPLAVAPGSQGNGIGRSLVQAGLDELRARGCPIVVVLGDPEYYRGCGFAPAAQLGITHGFAGIPQEVFLARILANAGLSLANSQAIFRPEFGEQSWPERADKQEG